MSNKSRSDDFKNHAGLIIPNFGEVGSLGSSYGAHNLTKDAPDGPDFGNPKPLIDRLHEATFTNPIGMQWCSDLYALRNVLRKAHCFTLDTETSGMVTDFSLAIANDLDTARQLAIPPFPTTWFQLDNHARLDRAKAHGLALTHTAAREDVIKDVGWLITTISPGEYCATYVCNLQQGVTIPPLSYSWAVSEGDPYHIGFTDKSRNIKNEQTKAMFDRLLFGLMVTNVNPGSAWLQPAPFQTKIMSRDEDGNPIAYLRKQEMDLMTEISGELRHIFGLLIALGAGQLGAETKVSEPKKFDGPKVIQKGKELFPLEHKVLTIKLGKRHTVEKIAMRALTGIKHRYHDVRGHFRTKYNSDGSVKWRVPVKPHHRGDKRLGRIEKTYRIEK